MEEDARRTDAGREVLVLEYMRENKGRWFTAVDLYGKVGFVNEYGVNVRISRRSISQYLHKLWKAGVLEKRETRVARNGTIRVLNAYTLKETERRTGDAKETAK